MSGIGLEILLIILIITWWIWVPGLFYLINVIFDVIILIIYIIGTTIFSLLVNIWDWIVDKLTK